jgi:hypothetical protein
VCSSALFVYVFCLRLTSGIIQLGGVEVKRLVTVVTPAILPAESILLGLTDLNISVADTNITDNEVSAVSIKAGEG